LRRFYYRFFDRLRFARMHYKRLRSVVSASSEAVLVNGQDARWPHRQDGCATA
jgi:hypothetical protein